MFVYTCVIIYAEDKEGGLRLNGMMEFFREWSRMTVGLKEAEKGRLIDSIAYYAITDATTDLTGKEACLLPVFQNFVDEKRCERTV